MNNIDNAKSYIRELIQLNKYNLTPCGYEKLDVSTAGVKSMTIPDGAKYAEIRVNSDITSQSPLRYLLLADVIPPTATDGLDLNNLDFFDLTGANILKNFRVIQTIAGTHVLHIQYYK